MLIIGLMPSLTRLYILPPLAGIKKLKPLRLIEFAFEITKNNNVEIFLVNFHLASKKLVRGS